MHALPGPPLIDVGLAARRGGPLVAAAAVVASVQDYAPDGEGGEAECDYEEHDDPAPVVGYPVLGFSVSNHHEEGGRCE